jgi:uncharacterized coiled-coil DUF342 family protein
VNSALVITITAVLGVLLTMAGSVGVWLAMRTGQNTQTVKNFRDAAASWREKAEALAADLATIQSELTTLRAQYDQLMAEHNMLKDVVSGRTAIEALGMQVENAKKDIIQEIRLQQHTK